MKQAGLELTWVTLTVTVATVPVTLIYIYDKTCLMWSSKGIRNDSQGCLLERTPTFHGLHQSGTTSHIVSDSLGRSHKTGFMVCDPCPKVKIK
jgi:hypothetical protein